MAPFIFPRSGTASPPLQRVRADAPRIAATLGVLLAAAVLVDLLLAVLYAHFPEDQLIRALAPSFPVSYKNWLMWAAFVPLVLGLVRTMTASQWPWAQRVACSFALAVALAAAHSGIEMWLHRMEGLHHVLSGGFLSYHVSHGLLTYSVVFVVALLIESDHAARVRQERELHLQRQATGAQLQVLRMQIQPHFLFNALNSVSALVEQDVRGGQRMIGQLSDFLRLTLASAEHEEVPLREELRLLGTYIAIQQARFAERLRVEYDISDEAQGARLPNLLLQPLVENAILHGIQPSIAGGTITLRGRRESDLLVVEILDDGVGLGGGSAAGAGLGLRNTRERLQQCYGERAAMEIMPRQGGGTAVVLRLPWSARPAAVEVGA